jgi:hypothetical protein
MGALSKGEMIEKLEQALELSRLTLIRTLAREVIASLREYDGEMQAQIVCAHERLDEDGICRQCGADKRGLGE